MRLFRNTIKVPFVVSLLLIFAYGLLLTAAPPDQAGAIQPPAPITATPEPMILTGDELLLKAIVKEVHTDHAEQTFQ